MKEKPLVSIIVITYHSAKYVLETLESCKVQTYNNIELIVSDDGSTDETVRICRDWIQTHSKRFVRTELVTAEKNTGIPANCNRGVRSAKGEWIKLIAGDDALLPTCIELNINYIKNHKQVHVLQSECIHYTDNFGEQNFSAISNLAQNPFFTYPAKKQLALLIKKNHLSAPSVFFSRISYDAVGGFDEDFRKIEDYPFWLRLVNSNYKFFSLAQPTVKYRIHSESVQKKEKPFITSDYVYELQMIDKKYRYPHMKSCQIRKVSFKRNLLVFLDENNFNRRSLLSKWIYRFVNHL